MRPVRFALALLATVAAAPAAAFEPTGSAVADALLRSLEASGYEGIAVGSVRSADNTVVLEEIDATAGEDDTTVGIDRVAIDSGVVDAQNALVAERITYQGTTIRGGAGGGTSTVERIVIDGVRYVPRQEGGVGLTSLFGSFDTLSVSGITARTAGGEAVTVQALSAAVDERDPQTALSGRLSVTALAFDTALWEEPTASRMRALGYERLSVDFSAAGRWQAETGRAELRQARMSAKDVGALEITASADGLTAQNIETIRESLQNVAEVLERLQTVSLTGLSVSYTDEGLADRLMAALSEEENLERAALADGLAAALANALSGLGDPAFVERAREAAARFLAEPGTIAVSAEPSRPVTLAELVGVGLLRPRTLPALLDIEITTAP
jgi:hypothetical protein